MTAVSAINVRSPFSGELVGTAPVAVEAFRAEPDWPLAVSLREIDDRGKVAGAVVPGLDAYRADLHSVVAARVVAGARA
jgi:hypothetical protein